MSGVDVSDVGTGISFSPATKFPHVSGDAVQALGSGITLDRPLAKGHAYGAPVVNPLATTVGYQGPPAPDQWFGGALSTRAGSIALMDVSGVVVVDAMVYGSQQSSSSANGTITSPEIATLEADQGKGGCIVVVPGAAGGAGRSRGRFPNGFDADSLCQDFLLQPSATLSAPSADGANNIKVSSVAGFVPGQTITIDTGPNLEKAVIATVGTAGATTVGAATDVGATVIPVAGGTGFSAGQTITIDSGANHETAVVASTAGGRGGARITVAAPLTVAHAAGAQVSGTGITLTAALAREHAGGVPVAGDVPTPGAPNRYHIPVAHVNRAWANVTPGTDPDGSGPATSFGYDSYARIQDAVNHVSTGATVNITAGTYPERLVIARDISLQASGVVTLHGSGGDGITITGGNVTLKGLNFAGYAKGVNVTGGTLNVSKPDQE
jgi:hypothetical protein